MCVFRADHSTLDTSSVLFLGRTTSPAPSFPQSPIVLCVDLRTHGLCPIPFSMFTGISSLVHEFGMFIGSAHFWVLSEFMCWASDVSRRRSLTANSPILWFLQPFCSCFHSVSWALEVLCSCIHWNWSPPLCILICWVFLYWSPYVAKRRFLEGWRLHLPVVIRPSFYASLVGIMPV